VCKIKLKLSIIGVEKFTPLKINSMTFDHLEEFLKVRKNEPETSLDGGNKNFFVPKLGQARNER
jgi:hypothetical protein